MDYGPDWPPRPRRPRRRLDVPMLRPFPLAVRGGVLAVLIVAFIVATVRGGYLRTVPFPMPATAPTAYATTVVGPPVAGSGHPRHPHGQ